MKKRKSRIQLARDHSFITQLPSAVRNFLCGSVVWLLTTDSTLLSEHPSTVSNDEAVLRQLASGSVASIKISDPNLKIAYRELFRQRSGDPVWKGAISNDLKRRGADAVPILFELWNEDTLFREEILFSLDSYPSIPAVKFLELTRTLVKSRLSDLSRRTCAAASTFLGRFGTQDDVALLELLVRRDPQGEIGWTASRHLNVLKKRLGTQPNLQMSQDMSSADMRISDLRSTDSTTDTKHDQPPIADQKLGQPWLAWCAMIVSAVGLLWLLLKNRK